MYKFEYIKSSFSFCLGREIPTRGIWSSHYESGRRKSRLAFLHNTSHLLPPCLPSSVSSSIFPPARFLIILSTYYSFIREFSHLGVINLNKKDYCWNSAYFKVIINRWYDFKRLSTTGTASSLYVSSCRFTYIRSSKWRNIGHEPLSRVELVCSGRHYRFFFFASLFGTNFKKISE